MEVPPNQTLYVNNLNDRISKTDLKLCLYTLFSTYGTVLDVVALKTAKMRGQAHIVFKDISSASAALKACNGLSFFGKEMHIKFAKGKSDVLSKLDGTFTLPETRKEQPDTNGEAHGVKRARSESEDEADE